MGAKAKFGREFINQQLLLIASKLKKISEKKFLVSLLGFNLFLRFFRIWDPGQTYFDEGPFYIKAARAYLNGVNTVNSEHPPLAKLIMAASIKLFGDNPIGWRLPAVFLGTVGVLTTYFLAKRITKSRKLAGLAAVFLTFEFGWFVASRVATIEIYLASFLLLGSFFVFKLFQENNPVNILPAGVFLGMAFASKWSAVFLIAWLFIFLVFFWKTSLRRKLFSLAATAEIVLAVYFFSYIPYLQTHRLQDFLNLQSWMVYYHTSYVVEIQRKAALVRGFQYPAYPAWTWVLDPVLNFYGKSFGRESAKAILFFYNPVALWGGFVAVVWMLKQQFKRLEPQSSFLLGAILSQYLPWFLAPRYSFNYYLLSAIPFLIVSFTMLLGKIERKNPTWLFAAAILVVVVFLVYYPLLSALKIPYLYSRLVSGVAEFVELKSGL